MTNEKAISRRGLLNLLVVYFFWGSTYLAIRVAGQSDGGFPPYILGGTRVLSAGAIILIWSAFRSENTKPTRSELVTLFFSGLML